MAASCNLIPQVRLKSGELVDSILFTDLLAQGKNRNEALLEYQQIFSTPFMESFGDWRNFPSRVVGKLDVNGEPLLTEAQLTLSSSSWNPKAKLPIARIEEITDAENLSTDDNTDVYEAKDSAGVVQRIYKRVTAFVDVAFGGRSWNRTPEENAAIKEYKKRGLEHSETIHIDGNDLTFQQYVELKRMDINTYGRIYGKLAHAIIQNAVKPTAKVAAEIRKYAAGEVGVSHAIEDWRYNWIEGSLKEVFRKVGINVKENVKPEKKDEMLPEITVFSKLLGIAGTVDGLIRHSNGDYSIADWKFGANFLKNIDNVDRFLNYGLSQIKDMTDTNLNRAKMEVVLRALILKEQYGNDTMFRWLKVVHLSKNDGATISEIDVRPFLGMIEAYYADPANGQTDVYQQLKDRGLLDAYNYINVSSELQDDTLNMSPLDQLEQKKRELSMFQYRVGHLARQVPLTPDEVAYEAKLTKEIAALEAGNGVSMNDTGISEMGFFKRWMGNKYSSKNPLVQSFFRLMDKGLDKARNAKQAVEDAHDVLLKKVKEEYYEKHATKGFLNSTTKGAINMLQYKELYDFMWVHKREAGREGWYANIIEDKGNGVYQNAQGKTYTEAQYNYNVFVREKMASEYSRVMNKVVRTENGRDITRAERMGMPAELDPDFMPRYMTSAEEVAERNGYLSKETVKYQLNNYLFNFTESLYKTEDIRYGIPIKYLGNDDIILSENHTFSAEMAFKNFMGSLIMKDELDDIYAMGTGVVGVLENTRDEKGNSRFGKDADFLRDQIYLNVLNINRDPKWAAEGFIKIPIGKDVNGNMRYREISPARLMRTAKSWVSAASMWLQLIGAGANAALIFILNANNAIAGSIAKRMGVDDSDVHFTISTMVKAHRDYGQLVYDRMRGKENENKLWLLAKKMNYLPDNYDYAVRKGDMVGVKNRLFDKGNFYIFHAVGEEYGALVVLAAQMNQYKLNGKPAMDQYEVQNGELVYVGGKRGKLHTGEELDELTADEITLFKRIYARIHGGYRQDERTALELTALGQWATQFRRYLPAALENLWQGKYDDTSIGHYRLMKREQGENVYQWISRVNEGRVRTMARFILHTSKLTYDPSYSWDRMKSEQRQNLIHLMLTGVTFGSLLVAKHMLFGDDDDDDPWARRLDRLADDTTQTLYVPDLLKSIQSQTIVLPKLYRSSVAITDLVFNGMILGKETKRGETVGAAGSVRALPFGSALKEMENFGVLGETTVRQ